MFYICVQSKCYETAPVAERFSAELSLTIFRPLFLKYLLKQLAENCEEFQLCVNVNVPLFGQTYFFTFVPVGQPCTVILVRSDILGVKQVYQAFSGTSKVRKQ